MMGRCIGTSKFFLGCRADENVSLSFYSHSNSLLYCIQSRDYFFHTFLVAPTDFPTASPVAIWDKTGCPEAYNSTDESYEDGSEVSVDDMAYKCKPYVSSSMLFVCLWLLFWPLFVCSIIENGKLFIYMILQSYAVLLNKLTNLV